MDNAPWPQLAHPPECKNFMIYHRKKILHENYVEVDFSKGNVLVIFSFFWMDNATCPHPWPPQFVKLLKSIEEKKYINENYVEFDFSMGTVILSNYSYYFK